MPSTTAIDPEALRAHAASVCGAEFVGPDNTAAPADTQQAAELLHYADSNDISICPAGAGTKMEWLGGAPAAMSLSTRRMNAVLEHTWQDMTCTVQAGCTWSALQARLGEQGQFVALDPLWADHATVGGVVASNDSGALRLRYGALRDLVIGMTLVLADGTIARSGGKVVKNVAGYDLPKLLCGSFGTLAFIADVTFRLHSKPLHITTLSMSASHAEPLGKLLLQVLDRHFSTVSMQLRGGPQGFALDLRLNAMPSVAAQQEEMLRGLGASMQPAEESVWAAREALFTDRDGWLIVKATMLPTGIAAAVQEIADAGGKVVAQATGILTGRVPRTSAGKLVRLRSWCEAQGGSLVLLHGDVVDGLDRWGTLPDSWPLMREVKRKFDPRITLNPGRFLGGI
ncbi:MAG TPA: FAD-binding oxidoreductase [Granulicella sp.]